MGGYFFFDDLRRWQDGCRSQITLGVLHSTPRKATAALSFPPALTPCSGLRGRCPPVKALWYDSQSRYTGLVGP